MNNGWTTWNRKKSNDNWRWRRVTVDEAVVVVVLAVVVGTVGVDLVPYTVARNHYQVSSVSSVGYGRFGEFQRRVKQPQLQLQLQLYGSSSSSRYWLWWSLRIWDVLLLGARCSPSFSVDTGGTSRSSPVWIDWTGSSQPSQLTGQPTTCLAIPMTVMTTSFLILFLFSFCFRLFSVEIVQSRSQQHHTVHTDDCR